MKPEAAFDLARLADLDRAELVRLWKEFFETAVPKSLSRPLACRYLAFELQSRALGGLPSGFPKRLAVLAGSDGPVPTQRLKSGGRYLREWGGVTHVVEVQDGQFLWQGKSWPSLTAIAREITGAHWSGPRFFGLTAVRAQGKKTATKDATRRPAKTAPKRPIPQHHASGFSA